MIVRLYHVVLLLMMMSLGTFAQFLPPSIHQMESENHRADRIAEPVSAAAVAESVPPCAPRTSALVKRVFGYHPYWVSSVAYLAYDYTALSTIGYFSYEVDPSTGAATTVHDWAKTPILAYAHSQGVKVVLVVTNFGDTQNTQILSDTVKQNTMIASLISLLTSRNGDGINIDFESVNKSQRANLVAFMSRLSQRVKAVIPSAEISMATPAVDWSNAWDFASLSSICDYFVLMGYDYYYSGSANAGPNSPLEASGGGISVTKSVTTYLAAGVAPAKLLLGLPWYGFDWPVTSTVQNAKVTSGATGATGVLGDLAPKAELYGKQFDAVSKSPWFNYQSGLQWHQVWFDDSLSLAYKYGLVNAKNLGGIGIWALSYQGARSEIWSGMHASFTATSVTARTPVTAPTEMALEQNFPNPFNPSTTIGYRIALAGHVSVKIVDVLGRDVATVVDDVKAPGSYQAHWDAAGRPSGVYICRLVSGTTTASRRLVLQK